MAVTIGYVPTNNNDLSSVKYYLCDTEAELPSASVEGELAYTKDTNKMWSSTSSGVWVELSGGGGSGTPSDTVSGETSFGVSSAAGVGTDYSRGDHTHGTPTNPVVYGSTVSTTCEGNDARLSDSRTPLAHKTSHENNGGDEISVSELSGLLADPQNPITASTTEVLTGTDTTKAVTPDALAALWEKGADIASSGTISIGEGGYFHVTGAVTITDIDPATDKAGREFTLVFDSILTLTYNATTLILPTSANIITAAGDSATFVSEGSDAVRCIEYQRRDGLALLSDGYPAALGYMRW